MPSQGLSPPFWATWRHWLSWHWTAINWTEPFLFLLVYSPNSMGYCFTQICWQDPFHHPCQDWRYLEGSCCTRMPWQREHPFWFSNLIELDFLYLYSNLFSGAIPSELCTIGAVIQIDCAEIVCSCYSWGPIGGAVCWLKSSICVVLVSALKYTLKIIAWIFKFLFDAALKAQEDLIRKRPYPIE